MPAQVQLKAAETGLVPAGLQLKAAEAERRDGTERASVQEGAPQHSNSGERATVQVGAPQHCGQVAEGRAAEAREQQSQRELLSTAVVREQQSERKILSTAEAREQGSERELLSTAAKGPREKQVAAKEQLSEGELLDLAARETNVSGLQETFEAREQWSEGGAPQHGGQEAKGKAGDGRRVTFRGGAP
jgi:hypothetical protein